MTESEVFRSTTPVKPYGFRDGSPASDRGCRPHRQVTDHERGAG